MDIQPVTEEELKSKTTGRRVTLEGVKANIASAYCFTAFDGVVGAGKVIGSQKNHQNLGLMTFCVILLKNGFSVTGQSACADPANYNQEIGERLAYEDAFNKIWPLMGYALKQDIYRDEKLLAERVVGPHNGMGVFIGTKVVNAVEMSRAAYNEFRGWPLPDDENGENEGYLVEYTDKEDGQIEGYKGYVSWSPRDVFERAYRPVTQMAESFPVKVETYEDRIRKEHAELSSRITKLSTFIGSSEAYRGLDADEQRDLQNQCEHMIAYEILLKRRMKRLHIEV